MHEIDFKLYNVFYLKSNVFSMTKNVRQSAMAKLTKFNEIRITNQLFKV